MADTSNINNESNQKSLQKKHSFFGGSINIHTKDFLDLSHNTQEEINQLDQNITEEQIDHNDENTKLEQSEPYIEQKSKKTTSESFISNENNVIEENLSNSTEISNESINKESNIDKESLEEEHNKEMKDLDNEEDDNEKEKDEKKNEKQNENNDEENGNTTNDSNSAFYDPFESSISDDTDILDPFGLDEDENDEDENDENNKEKGHNGNEELFDPFSSEMNEHDEQKNIKHNNQTTEEDEIFDPFELDEYDDNEPENISLDNQKDNLSIINNEQNKIDENLGSTAREKSDSEKDFGINTEDDNEKEKDDNEEKIENENEFNNSGSNEGNEDFITEEEIEDSTEEIINEYSDNNIENTFINTSECDTIEKAILKENFKNNNTEENSIEEKMENSISDEEFFEQEKTPPANDEISQQFFNLVSICRKIFNIEYKMNNNEGSFFKIIGGKSENYLREYNFYLIEEDNITDLFIKKIDTKDDLEEEHLVQFSYNLEEQNLDIFVDEVILYNKINKSDSESQSYNDTKSILEKFTFLTQTYYNDIKSKRDYLCSEQEKKKNLQQIFKGF